MLSILSKLEDQIENEEVPGICSQFECLQSSAFDVESGVLYSELKPVREFSIHLEAYKIERDSMKNDLKFFFEELSEIRDYFDDEDIDANPQSFFDRRREAIARTARDVAKSELDIDGVKELVNNIQSQLTFKSVSKAYRNEIVDNLEEHLLEEDELDDSDPRTNIQFLFTELGKRDWPRACVEKVIKSFWIGDYDSAEERIAVFSERVRDVDTERTVYIPLHEFPSELSGIKLDNVLIEDRNATEIEFDKRFDPVYDGLRDDIENMEIIAKITVTGDLNELARLRATDDLEKVFDILNFGEKYPLKSPVADEIMRFYTDDDDDNIRLLHGKANLKYLDKNSKDKVLEKLDYFGTLFQQNGETELKKAMKNSMRWHRYGIDSNQPSDKFLKFVIALKSILVPKKEATKSPNIAERGVILLSVLGPYRGEYSQFFEDVYSVRSKIAHNAEYRLSEIDLELEKLRQQSTRILSTVKNHLDSSDSISEILDDIESGNEEIRQDRISDAPVEPGDSFTTDAKLRQYDPNKEDTVSVGEIELRGNLKDDGYFVYYDADVVGFERKIEDDIIMNTEYDLVFEHDDVTYESEDISFVDGFVSDLALASEENPVSIRFYDVDLISEGE